MRTKPWSFKEGIVVGCGLLAASMVLQLSVGLIDWGLTAWPVNIILLVSLVVLIVAMHLLRRKVYLFRWLGTSVCAISAMTFATLVTVVLGLTAQAPPTDDDAPWLSRLLSSWPFVSMYLWVGVSLGMTILKVGSRRWTWRTVAFMLNHAGLFVVLFTAALGNADIQRLNMVVGRESLGYGPQTVAYNDLSPAHEPVVMDFALVLKDFEIEYYSADSNTSQTSMPKSFTSHVGVYVMEDEGISFRGDTVVQVNKPLTVNGWKIYQYGYDASMGASSPYSEFRLVRDPWLPWVYLGIFMMLAGALSLLFSSPSKAKKP